MTWPGLASLAALKVDRLQRRNTAFVTLPIVALAAASIAVVIASLVIGAHEADTIALTRQRETVEHALDQHGLALARELRVQTVWTESYDRTRAHDTAWMQTFYGSYLTQLLGYDRIYVLASDNTPVFGFVALTHRSRIISPAWLAGCAISSKPSATPKPICPPTTSSRPKFPSATAHRHCIAPWPTSGRSTDGRQPW